ncbi:protein kinase [Micromonospora sp. NPDC049836]|uniref:serine/threonine-protein kinase n=1 Tax=Micromonospora sp. NPDC049836 TaxID=3364274 RepID=UPI0037992536
MGDLVGARYRLTERIAAGGMGEVWRAVDQTLKRDVAVKVLHGRAVTEASAGERFRREARAMAALRHPGVAEVYDYGETGLPGEPGTAYLVMAYVRGQPLSARIAEAGRLGTAETMSIVAQTARALQAAHEVGVVHRDVKPGNLVIEPDGHVVLVDFGIALSADAAELTAANQVMGTALYMAPEQLGKTGVSPAVDIYALGAVAYHCLAGHPPFPGDNPIAVALRRLDEEPPPLPDDVPPAVGDLVATAMAREPERRFPTAAAMADTADTLSGPPGEHPVAGPLDERLGAGPLGAHPAAGSPGEGPEALPATVAVPRAVAPPPAPAAGPTGRAGGRRRAIAGLVVTGLAAVAAVLVFADGTGWSPGRSGEPTPSVTRSGEPGPAGGDPRQTPGKAHDTTPGRRATPTAGGASGAASAGPQPARTDRPAPTGGTPSDAPASESPAEPTAAPTDEPDTQSSAPSPQATTE